MFLKCDPDMPVPCCFKREPELNVCMLLYVQAEKLHEHLYNATLQCSSLLRATRSQMPPIHEGSPDSIEDVLPGSDSLLREGPSLKMNGAEQRGSSTAAHRKGQIQGNAAEGLNSVAPGSPPGSTALERNTDRQDHVNFFDNAPSLDSQQVQSVHSGNPSKKETGSLSLPTMNVSEGGSILTLLGRSQKLHPDIDRTTTRQSPPVNLVARMDGIASGHGMKKHESSNRAAAGCPEINKGNGNIMDLYDQNQHVEKHLLDLVEVGKTDDLSVLTYDTYMRTQEKSNHKE